MKLVFKQAEKRLSDSTVFGAFDLAVGEGECVALHCSVNIRQQLMAILSGQAHLSAGEILLDNSPVAKKDGNIGLLFLEGSFYERLTVQESLVFQSRLFCSSQSVKNVLELVQLEPKRNDRTIKLSHSEKKRLQMASLLIQDPQIYILEEPDQNLDNESRRIFLSLFSTLRQQNKSIVVLTGNMESAVTSGGAVYRLDEDGLQPVEVVEDGNEEPAKEVMEPEMVQPIRFEKIPTKVNEKIVLFDPPEIDYIESIDGQSFLYIKGESFPSFFTLADLEQRLLPFGFFRCHRSYIVNLQKVREVITWTKNSYSLVLDDQKKSQIPLSKTKMASLKEMLGLK